jgi:hypothetical protein
MRSQDAELLIVIESGPSGFKAGSDQWILLAGARQQDMLQAMGKSL